MEIKFSTVSELIYNIFTTIRTFLVLYTLPEYMLDLGLLLQ